jgi:GAF domain-containing protein
LGQTRLSLAELEARKPPDYGPVHGGERVIVRGVVSGPAFHFLDYTLLGLQDAGWGGVLHAPKDDAKLDAYRAGDEIEAEGVVAELGGMPVVEAERITETGTQQPPAAITVPLRDLLNFPQNLRYLGRLVDTEGRIVEKGDNTGGAYMLLGPVRAQYKLFIPGASFRADLGGFEEGDTVSVTGVALQFCPRAPYDQYFELLAHNSTGIALRERGWMPPPLALAGGLTLVLLVSFFLWSRERRLRKQRERLRKMYHLAEEILGAASTAGILKRISDALPGVLGVTRIQLYVYNRATKALDAAAGEGSEPVSISLASPPGGTQAGAVACFHYHTLLAIPDISRSPFPIAGDGGDREPRSVVFVPMLAQAEVMGVLELDQDDRVREFTADEQALAQHLGNQIGVAIRLLDQRSVQEQLFRTEKLAAVGRLISGIVNELRTPIASISELAAEALRNQRTGPGGREVAAIASEAQRAAGMVARLMAFGGSDFADVRPVCISTLLRNLIEFREADWKASGIRVKDLTSGEPLFVRGSQGQLEQVFLHLLVHAEQSLAAVPEKAITIRSSVLGKRLVVEIAFTAPPESRTPEETAAALGVARSVVTGHGGEVRLIAKDGEPPCFEVELPLAKERAPAGPARDSALRLTVLVIEPDESAERQLLALLGARGCRVVPVSNADAGLELAQRLHFDVAFCSVHAPGLNWVELSERMQPRVGGFILLSDHYDAELSADFEGEGRFVLPKPLQEQELERALGLIERQVGARSA